MSGFSIRTETKPVRGGRLFASVGAALLYAALWGALSSMAAMSAAGLGPLAAGFVLAALLPLLPGRRGALYALAAGLTAASILAALRWPDVRDGAWLLLDRLFAASEARQAYLYEHPAVSAGMAQLRRALLPLGMLSGLLCGFSGRVRGLAALPFALWAGFAAWLGVTPAAGWCLLFAPALLLTLTEVRGLPGALPAAAAAAALAAVVLLLLPGENPTVSAWDERARDAAARQTAAWTEDLREYLAQPPRSGSAAVRPFYRAEDMPADTGGDEEPLRIRWPVILAVLLAALLLFGPAICSDRLKKRRAKSRAGLDDADAAAAVRAMFLYAMRWLEQGGLTAENRPWASRAAEIGTLYGDGLRQAFEEAVPLWREAAYSGHALSEAQRAAMRGFLDAAMTAARGKLTRRQRFRARYIEAL